MSKEEKTLLKKLRKQFKALSDHDASFDKFMDNVRKNIAAKKCNGTLRKWCDTGGSPGQAL